MTRKENNIVLFSITLCWASSYIFIKDLPDDLSSYAYLTLTTGIAAIILVVIFIKQLLKTDKAAIIRSFILALLTAGDLLAEKVALTTLPSSNASFIASLNIIFVPLILLLHHQKLSKNNKMGIMVILLGIFITANFSIKSFMNTGTFYMITGCLLIAVYTVVAADFTKKSDPLILGVMQIVFTAIIGFVLWFIEDPATFKTINYDKQMLSSIFILAFFTKAYAYIMLMYSQKYASALSVTIIASSEPIVTLGLALLIPNAFGQTESFHARSFAGAICIAIGAIIAGTDFLNKRKSSEVLN